MRNNTTIFASLFLALAGLTAAAAVAPTQNDALASKALRRPGEVIGQRAVPIASLPFDDALRRGWEAFADDQDGSWRIWLDERAGLPRLAIGSGIPWIPGRGNDLPAGIPDDLDTLEGLARALLADYPALLGRWSDQLVLDEGASVRRGDHVRQLTFRQQVGGIPVEGARYDFQLSHGNLVSFGAHRWGIVSISPVPVVDEAAARALLDEWLGPEARALLTTMRSSELLIVPEDPAELRAAGHAGPRGRGYAHRLIWRFRYEDATGVELWAGEVDAKTGTVVAFYDAADHDRVKGGVHPMSDDGDCTAGGCQEPDWPMPFTDLSEQSGATRYAGQHGLYECAVEGQSITTRLDGRYFTIEDACGPIAETATCGSDLDLGSGSGFNCFTVGATSLGDTDAARTAYYALNTVARKARFWDNDQSDWLDTQVEVHTNENKFCNANWNGRINMFRRGSTTLTSDFCGNTGEINGILAHEWGHGYDRNDGGGGNNSSEAFADVVAIFEARQSCMGRGFYRDGVCAGYGDTCLTCTGIRELDWNARTAQTPATPQNFNDDECAANGTGNGTCGFGVHCESYVPSEAIFDLATRDLPGSGLSAATSWQLAERLFYQSRPGTGGDIYNCSRPVPNGPLDSDGCGTTGWFHELRLQDDDDGDLTNGTPHAAEIFDAFDRHNIACGASTDPENQSTSGCPAVGTPAVSVTRLSHAVEVAWGAVANAGGYRIYRNELGCDRGQFPLAEVDASTTSYLDRDLIDGFDVNYRVQTFGVNTACEGEVSACTTTSANGSAGWPALDLDTYGCGNTVTITVYDANHGAGSLTVDVSSDTETTPETITLDEVGTGSGRYVGTIVTTRDPAAADGLLSVTDGDVLQAVYLDADDGDGALNVNRQSVADVSCCPDLDGDGFIDCDQPGCDEVGPSCGDCNDGDALVSPGATEVCNHVDDDCNGDVDESALTRIAALRVVVDVDSNDNDQLGQAMANLGDDVNGDGVDEFLVGAAKDSPEQTSVAGAVLLYSGATQEKLCTAVDPNGNSGDRLGYAIASISDVDGDGIRDFAAGAEQGDVPVSGAGIIVIFSGADCSHIRTLSDPAAVTSDNIGYSVADVGDLNGDGISEVATGSPATWISGTSSVGRVLVFDPTDGSIVFNLTDPSGAQSDQLGTSVAGPGDWNGDGTPDIFAGAYQRRLANVDPMEPDCVNAGEVVIFSGLDGSVIGRDNNGCDTSDPDFPSGSFENYGWSMAVIGDVTGDGIAEVAVGALDGDIHNSGGPNWTNYGFVRIIKSGGSGGATKLSDTSQGATGDDFGYSVSGVDDADGDGWPDIVVGSHKGSGPGGTSAGRFYLFSGRTGAMLHRVINDGAGDELLGSAVTGLDDLDGDGLAEFAGASTQAEGQEAADAGKVVIASRQADCDGDGVARWAGDCDDDNVDVAPGLVELCDNFDNDCDGQVNEDQDGDGFNVCRDCDDSDRFINKDAPERCNGIDDNCDGNADEGSDNDGDTFTTACDCNDNDFDIKPGAVEICDGIDQDCNGVIDDGAATPVARVTIQDDPAGIDTSEDFGWSVTVGEDLDDDGISEIFVGSRWDDGSADRTGALFVYDGATRSRLCTFRAAGEQASDELGTSVSVRPSGANAHVAIGVPGDDQMASAAGKVVEVRVTPGGSCTQFREFVDPLGQANDELGTSVAWLDDLNDDGNPELAVGAPFADINGEANAGQVVVFSGTGLSVLYRLTAQYPRPSNHFGMAVARIGDVDMDGYDDIAVGAPRDDLSPGQLHGSVEVFSGDDGRFLYKLIDPDRTTGDNLGTSVAGIDDLDGDSIPDILAGVPFDDEGGTNGGAVVAFSGLTGQAIGKAFVSEPGLQENIGHSVASMPDITGDGIPEFVAGGPNDDTPANNAGAVYVFSGSDFTLLHKWTDPTSDTNANLGWSLAVTDLSGDGMPEVIAGEPGGNSLEELGSGKLMIFSLEADCDGDGYSPWAGDCNDSVDVISPGHPEVCDTFDNDCDTLVDEDEDADGFDACADCDNANPLVFPGATEVCNGIDDDCNMQTDEGTDLDGDGFSGCDDCDETSFDVNTSATDTCNGIDDDCDGTADEDFVTVPETLEVVDPQPESQNRLGRTLARIDDLDGDGVDDLLAGLELAESVTANTGAVLVVSGATMAGRCRLTDPGGANGDNLGASVAAIDDVTGDGVPDILAGADNEDTVASNAGAALIFDGATCAFVEKITDPQAEDGDDFGAEVAGLHDLDGDGIGEIAVGDPLRDGPDGINVGTVVVYRGSNRTEMFRLADPDGRAGDWLGTEIVALDDVDMDGVPDIGVSAPFDNVVRDGTSRTDAGSVVVFSGADGSWIRTLYDPVGSTASNVGSALATIDDLDGDGTDDLLAGIPGDDDPVGNAGTVIALSPRTGALIRRYVDPARGSGSRLGTSVTAVPDMNGDGVQEILAGAPEADDVASNAGYAIVFSGADGTVLHELSDLGGVAGDELGSAVAHLTDLSGGGTVELVVGAEFADPGGLSSSGKLVLFAFEPDCDGDGFSSLLDCDDTDINSQGGPGEAQNLVFSDKTTVSWAAPAGGDANLGYDVISSDDAADFVTNGTCELTNFVATSTTIGTVPASGTTLNVLVRAQNRCGEGTLGTDSNSTERSGPACP